MEKENIKELNFSPICDVDEWGIEAQSSISYFKITFNEKIKKFTPHMEHLYIDRGKAFDEVDTIDEAKDILNEENKEEIIMAVKALKEKLF